MQFVFQEIRTFLITIVDWIVLVVIFTLFFLTFNTTPLVVLSYTVSVPIPMEPSFSADFFTMLVSDIAPPNVPLIVTSPMTAFMIQAQLAFLLSVFFTFPVLLLRLIAYFSPALYKHEMRIVYLLLAPLCLLFFSGVYFAYFFVIPATFKVLYEMTAPIGVTPMLEVGEFINMTGALLFVTGVTFTIPVFMVFLTMLGAIPAAFWRKNTGFAIIFFLIVSAIITPDGSGVSMLLLSLPISFLYGAGTLVCVGIERVRERRKNRSVIKNK